MSGIFIAYLGEIRKGLLISWTYRANALVSILTIGFVFIGIGFLMTGGELDPGEMGFIYLGYLNWFFALGAINDLSWGIRSEMNAGTLEQMSMSPAPIGVILLGRSTASLLWNSAILAVQSIGLFLILGIRLPMRPAGLLILLATLVGTYGFGFIMAGATIIFKQFESFSNLFQNMLMFLNGTLLPTTVMPGWLASVAVTLPTTQGVAVLRRVILENVSLVQAWQDGDLLWLAVHSTVFFILGWVVFSCCEQAAKDQGSLGQY